jgi:hypothetical protein
MFKKTMLILVAALGLTMSVKAITTVHTLAEALSQGYKPLPDPDWLYYLVTDISVGDGTWNHTIQFVNPTPKFASLEVKASRPGKTKEGYIHVSVDLLQAKGDKVYVGSVSFTDDHRSSNWDVKLDWTRTTLLQNEFHEKATQ